MRHVPSWFFEHITSSSSPTEPPRSWGFLLGGQSQQKAQAPRATPVEVDEDESADLEDLWIKPGGEELGALGVFDGFWSFSYPMFPH